MSVPSAPAVEMAQSRDRLRLLAVILFSAIGPLVLLTAPALVSRYIVELGMDNRQVGWLFSLELGAMAISTLPTYLWMRRYDWRWIAGLAGSLFLLGNLFSAWLMSEPSPASVSWPPCVFSRPSAKPRWCWCAWAPPEPCPTPPARSACGSPASWCWRRCACSSCHGCSSTGASPASSC
ncbi:hypothetical protein I9018_19340 [Pseudomonas sp. MPFS]|uniref:hypothetical protein n=1 Tax=Pseudomonas sp. MPFS TaxID=2795724 RepID=UPI001F12BD41|nr:hypothetical protein [Pseudomonas sp. MPFS]UMZ09676.1 hypothetical protein I9018_19340 [Pseudomonas sp. MPFS]